MAARKEQKSKLPKRQVKPLLDETAPLAGSLAARTPQKNPRWLMISIMLFVLWLAFLIYTALGG